MVEQRFEDPTDAAEPLELMLSAVRRAADDAGPAGLLSRVQYIGMPKGQWHYEDAGRAIANAIGAAGATTVTALVGVLQQTLIGDACRRIADGELDVALIVGGEARYRVLRGRILGVDTPETEAPGAPDRVMSPSADLVLRSEIDAGLGPMPVGYYAIIESAIRAANGESVDAHRDRLAAMYSRFTEIAAANPHAWKREPLDATAIRDATAKNPMLAFPYTKLHNSSWNVDQATALLLCSAAVARATGVDPERCVYARSSAESNHATTISERPELARSPGARLAGRAALDHAGVGARDVALTDLYTCFPAAVQLHASEVGVADDADWTVTGAMPFAGGPFNSYVLQATGRMLELLRTQPGDVGLVSSVSGLLTKQGFGVWSTEPGPHPFASIDVTDQVVAETPTHPVVDRATGDGTIVGCTVVYGGEGRTGVALVQRDDGTRTMAGTTDEAIINEMESAECCGRRVRTDSAQLRF